MNTKRQVALAVAIFLLIFEGTMWTFIWKYRSHRLFRVRGLASLFGTTGLWSLGGIFWNLSIVFELPCFPSLVFQMLAHSLVCFFFVEKFCMILINFAINQEAVVLANEEENHEIQLDESLFSQAWSKWIFYHRKNFTADWNSPSKLFTVAISLVYSLAAVICLGFLTANLNSVFCSDACYDVLIPYWRFALITGSIPIGTVIISTFRFLKVKETFYLKQELALYSTLGVMCTIVLGYRALSPQDMQIRFDSTVMLYGVVLLGLITVLTKCICIFIIFKARKELSISTDHGSTIQSFSLQAVPAKVQNHNEDFLQMLYNDSERELFKGFLITEFSVENLLFWEAIHSLKRIEDTNHQCKKAIHIVHDFCSEHSKHEVNLSCSQSTELRGCVKKLETKSDLATEEEMKKLINSLRDAQKSIETLMFEDSYRRFRKKEKKNLKSGSVAYAGSSAKVELKRERFPVGSLEI
jgi:hypothetical protein